MTNKISLDNISGNTAYSFATLYNALLDAGWNESFAAATAKEVVSGGIKVDCNCKK